MRPVTADDRMIGARAILCAPPMRRYVRAIALLRAARTADRYRKRLHRRHLLWGDGTLAEAARLSVCRLAPPDAPDILHALRIVDMAIAAEEGFDLTRTGLYEGS